jgi:RHH-type proline utilization regulon transcriptional repressor/proline dehydrogenase/delta 1-pyrroline-5-carboxylate dehydrogenase
LLAASAVSERVRSAVGGACELVADPLAAEPDAVLFAGGTDGAQQMRRRLAALPGPIVPLIVAGVHGYDWTRLVSERTITINTTASGGNASLLSLTETPG